MEQHRYAIGKPGQTPRVLVVSTPDVIAANVGAGEVSIRADDLPDEPFQISADGQKLVQVTVPIDTLRTRRWREAKYYRATKMAGGCASPLGRVQTDDISRVRISESATDATNNKLAVPAWSIVWRMADNSQVAHNAVQMIAMQTAVRAFTTACQAASDAIRTKIYAATTAAAVAAVDITAGYPT